MISLRPGPGVVLGVVGMWLALKIHTIQAWVIQTNQFGDTDYYRWALSHASQDGSVARWLTEYPTPAAWFLQLPLLWGPDTDPGYRLGFMVLISLVDLAFVLFLLLRFGFASAAVWVVMVALSGQLGVLRMDLLPAVLAAAGLASVLFVGSDDRTPPRGSWALAPVLVALGTAAKVWPIVLFPLTLARRGTRLRTTAVFAASGIVLVVVSVLGAGWRRLLSPLDYQADRGLQIEAVAATVPMRNAHAGPGYDIHYSTFKAFEVRGPGVDAWLQVATVASVASVVVGAALLVWWWLRGCPPAVTGYLGLLFVALFVATSKAYSPQYTLWLAALAAVLLGAAHIDPDEHPPAWAWLVVGLTTALTVLTTTVYPTYYGAVVSTSADSAFAVNALTARNLLLVALVALLLALIVDRLRVGPVTARRAQ